MNRFTTTILMSLALFTGACDDDADNAPIAEESVEVEGAREGAREGRRGGKFARLDVDNDGAISLAEAKGSRLEGKFAALDANNDGKLTRDEMKAMKLRDGAHKDPGKRADMLLAKLDADKDGALSQAELAAKFKQHEGKSPEKFAERFKQADANGDGKLSRDELAAMKGHGRRHGGPGGGFHKDPGKRADMLLGKLDANKDGSISKAEVNGSRFAEMFAAVDTNGDARVTRDELLAFRGPRGERPEGQRRVR